MANHSNYTRMLLTVEIMDRYLAAKSRSEKDRLFLEAYEMLNGFKRFEQMAPAIRVKAEAKEAQSQRKRRLADLSAPSGPHAGVRL